MLKQLVSEMHKWLQRVAMIFALLLCICTVLSNSESTLTCTMIFFMIVL